MTMTEDVLVGGLKVEFKELGGVMSEDKDDKDNDTAMQLLVECLKSL